MTEDVPGKYLKQLSPISNFQEKNTSHYIPGIQLYHDTILITPWSICIVYLFYGLFIFTLKPTNKHSSKSHEKLLCES